MKRLLFDPTQPGQTLFESITDMRNLELAHYNASRGKRWYPEVKMVNRDLYKHLKYVQNILHDHTYRTSQYRIFQKVEGDKIREIYSLPYYPDRIVQWAIIQVIGPILERHFIYDTYSSIKGKGPLLCMNRVYKAMHFHQENTKCCLKMDIHHFYPSIDRVVLKMKYARLFKDRDLLMVLYEIIDSMPGDVGVPIGNYMSQYSGNLYLSEFDHWLKEEKHIKYYYRYMDDMVILHDDFNYLKDLFVEIKEKIENDLKLTIKPNYQLFYTCDQGIDFCGYVIYHNYVKLRKRIRANLRSKCKRYKREKMNDHNLASMNSYMGFLQHANTKNLQEKYVSPVYRNWLEEYDKKDIYHTRRHWP